MALEVKRKDKAEGLKADENSTKATITTIAAKKVSALISSSFMMCF
jgi:hypothetical protein